MAHENEKRLVECLNEFEFKRVHRVMKFLKWKWARKIPCHVPSISELKEEASRQLFECLEHSETHKEDWLVSSGGFETHSYYENGNIDFCLKFVLTEYTTC